MIGENLFQIKDHCAVWRELDIACMCTCGACMGIRIAVHGEGCMPVAGWEAEVLPCAAAIESDPYFFPAVLHGGSVERISDDAGWELRVKSYVFRDLRACIHAEGGVSFPEPDELFCVSYHVFVSMFPVPVEGIDAVRRIV